MATVVALASAAGCAAIEASSLVGAVASLDTDALESPTALASMDCPRAAVENNSEAVTTESVKNEEHPVARIRSRNRTASEGDAHRAQ
jgi:hypothetical protein